MSSLGAGGIEETIGIQVRELNGISETIAADMSAVEENIRREVAEVNSLAENTITNIQTVTKLLEEKLACWAL